MLSACRRRPPASIEAYFPFTFTGKVDPRAVLTVGDQVVCEHVFAFHARQSIESGFEPVVSRISFPPDGRRMTIAPRFALKTSDGSPFPLKSVCRGLRDSLGGTRHAPYGALLRSIDCGSGDGKIQIHLSRVPVNMRFLLTLPDFSLYDGSVLPLTPTHLAPTTGPYSVVSMRPDRVELERNPYYPRKLAANTVETVRLHSYPAAGTGALIARMNAARQHMLYFYGYALTDEDLATIRKKGYKVEIYPDEWLIYAGFGRKVALRDRESIASFVDLNRERWLKKQSLGVPAYSLSPADREFGLTRSQYETAAARARPAPLSRKRRLVTLRAWYGLPLFRSVCDGLLRRFPRLELRLVDGFDGLFSGDQDVFVSPLGISQADPLTHMAFLAQVLPNFRQAVGTGDVARAAVMSDPARFVKTIRGFERRIAGRRIVVPIAHFPGVVAHAPRFVRDEDLSFSWGIQTWSYRVR